MFRYDIYGPVTGGSLCILFTIIYFDVGRPQRSSRGHCQVRVRHGYRGNMDTQVIDGKERTKKGNVDTQVIDGKGMF